MRGTITTTNSGRTRTGSESRRCRQELLSVVVTVAVMTKSRVDLVMAIGVLGVNTRHGHTTLLALHGRVEMVLDCIVRAAGHMLSHLGPLGS